MSEPPPEVPEEEQYKILVSNAVEFFHLEN